MRDKVKRFISILMTALMLVNLLPVGALAEGMKLDSNSVRAERAKSLLTFMCTSKLRATRQA